MAALRLSAHTVCQFQPWLVLPMIGMCTRLQAQLMMSWKVFTALPSLPSCGAASVHAAPLQSAGAQPNVALSLRSVPTRRSHERQCPPAAVPVQSRPAPPGIAGLQAALARGAAPVGGARVKSGFVFPIRRGGLRAAADHPALTHG
jgi:hypothetical protein